MLREYITDKMNVRKVEKDCLISYAVNKEHYRPLMTRQTFHVKNTMIHGPEIIDYSIVPDDLSQYDSLIGGGFVVFSMKKRRTYMPAFSMVIFSFHFLTIVSMNSNFLCVSLR